MRIPVIGPKRASGAAPKGLEAFPFNSAGCEPVRHNSGAFRGKPESILLLTIREPFHEYSQCGISDQLRQDRLQWLR